MKDGLHFTFGFSDPEMIRWEDIDNAWDRNHSVKLVLRDDTSITIPVLNRKTKEEALEQIAKSINERMLSDIEPGDGPHVDGES